SPYHSGINPEGDYLNPRVFDLAAAGAFQLVDLRLQLPEFFRPEEELATFASLSEARDKIDYFLAHDNERCGVAARGRQRCLAEHTYEHRLKEALAILADFFPELRGRPRPEHPVDQLRRQFPPDHPLQAVLAAVPPEVTDLAGVVEHLQTGEEPLTEAEALLWLLHEFRQGLQRGRF
ncbi:MAG: glycosyltransferase family 1 protein, partial [Deltaproteobacteria bacterium]|nr:glycosyltransferase family 1 protein [Deltaproteobacteria bacterium]